MIFAGIDAGSRAIKVALYDAREKRVLAEGVADQGVEQAALAREVYEQALAQAGLAAGDASRIVATGYGRNLVSFADTTITEITCHARGVRHSAPDTRTIIEIGGQDSKVIKLDGAGVVRDFAMNDRCAGGTGRFLEVVSSRLGVSLDDLGALAATSKSPSAISSMCVVFAETEIIGLLASGAAPADIVAGVQNAITTRVVALAGRRIQEPVLFTGGVALLSGMRESLERALAMPVQLAAMPQMTGALGAALLAAGTELDRITE